MPDMKTITETQAAQMLNVSRTTVRRACARGILKCVRGGLDGTRVIGIAHESVQRLLKKRNANPVI